MFRLEHRALYWSVLLLTEREPWPMELYVGLSGMTWVGILLIGHFEWFSNVNPKFLTTYPKQHQNSLADVIGYRRRTCRVAFSAAAGESR